MSVGLVAAAAALLTLPGGSATVRLGGLAAPGEQHERRRVSLRMTWIVVGATAVGGLVAGVGGGMAGLLVGAAWARRRARRRHAVTGAVAGAELADALARITDELRSGAHPAAALAGIDDDGPAARAVLGPAEAAARMGETVPAALTRTRAHPALAADVERVAGAWALSDRHGVPLADLLAGVGADLRWKIEFGRRINAELAGPRATATILTALPVLGVGLGQLMGADPIGVLRTGFLGTALLVGGVALTTAGMAWAEHILRAAVPR